MQQVAEISVPSAFSNDLTVGPLVSRGAVSRLHKGLWGEEEVAIKIYSGQWLASEERIRRECAAQQQINHPCVGRSLESRRLDCGSQALICSWIKGESLEERLQACHTLAWEPILPILRDLARGLGAVHSAGIVHRDLKPSNIMLPQDGSQAAVIIDFGHALLLDETRMTSTGLALGTAHYMAPEQATGSTIDAQADLYSLGAILYRMLTGVTPFDAPSAAEVLHQHCHEQLTPPSQRSNVDIPQEAEDLCLWLLAKKPSHRLPNAHVLRLTLDSLAPSRK